MNTAKLLYWVPRIVSILFILFLSLFSLDVFGNGYTFWQTVVAFLMHNIPVFILIILLVVAWKYEIVGAIAFALAGLLYILQIVINVINNPFEVYMLSYSIIIAGPAFLIAGLFLMGWLRKKIKPTVVSSSSKVKQSNHRTSRKKKS